MKKTLLILTGPTGVGKTELSLRIAERFSAPVISADSRQFYKDLAIGSSAPVLNQLLRATHYMVGILGLNDYYSAACFEADVLAILGKLHANPAAILTGGSMMYIDAVCKGIDDMPAVTPDIRNAVWDKYEREGRAAILDELKAADPVHYDKVDKLNHKRIIHAVEVCRQTGRPYSDFCTNTGKPRPFRTVKVGLTRDRATLCERINRRVDQMMADGLLDEARRLYPFKHLNALNTIGYKELFEYIDGCRTLDAAVEKIKRNSRVYARKQMTWLKRDNEIVWFNPDNEADILKHIDDAIRPLRL